MNSTEPVVDAELLVVLCPNDSATARAALDDAGWLRADVETYTVDLDAPPANVRPWLDEVRAAVQELPGAVVAVYPTRYALDGGPLDWMDVDAVDLLRARGVTFAYALPL